MIYLQTLSNTDTSPNLLMIIKIEVERTRKGKTKLNILSFIPEMREATMS